MVYRTLLLGILLAVTPALAASGPEVSADQAQQVQQQIEAWFSSTFGTPVPPGQHPVVVTPEEDHYRLTVPFQGLSDGPTPLQLTMAAQKLDASRWAIEHAGFTLPAQFTLTQPLPDQDKQPASTVKIHYIVTAKAQDGTGLWDPSFSTTSTLSQSATGLRSEASGENLHQVTEVALSHGTTVIQPVDTNHIDVNMEGTVEGFSQESLAEATAFRLGIKMGRVTGAMTGVQRDRVGAALQGTVTAWKVSQTMPKEAQGSFMTRALLDGLRGLADGFVLDETLEEISVVARGREYDVSSGRLGIEVQAVKGLADISLSVALQGIVGAQPSPFEMFLPSTVTLKPHVTGLTSKQLLDYLTAVFQPGSDQQALAQELLAVGGVEAGLDQFELVLGRTSLTGTTTAHFNPGGIPRITAEISASNFDDLTTKAAATPFAAQTTPVLLLVKGLGRISGDRLLWSVLSDNGRTTVNGTDLSALTEGVR